MNPDQTRPRDRGDDHAAAGALRWLASLAGPGRNWLRLSVAAGLAQTLATVALAAAMAWVIHGLVIDGRSLAELHLAFFAIPGAVVLRAFAAFVREEAGLRVSLHVRDELRTRMLDGLRERGPAWQARQRGGVVVTRVLEQVDALDGYFARYLPQRWLALLVPVVILATVMPLNVVAGLILLATAPLIPLFMVIVGHGARARQERQMEALTQLSGQFLDTLRGLTALRLLDAHRRHADVVARSAEGFRSRTMSVLRLAFLSGTVLEFFASLAIALSAVYLGFGLLGYLEAGFGGELPSLFVALFILMLAPEYYLPLRELGSHYHARAEALAAAGSLREWLNDEAMPPAAPPGPRRPERRRAPAIEIAALSFAYRDEVPVLSGLDLSIAAGETVALTGVSGSGKTTLLRLLLGQLSPQGGRVLIDGVPLEGLDRADWREQVGWMGQHPRLMAASLADNMRLARHDASDDELSAALCFAGLDGWYRSLPDGLDTVLGEGGLLVSGGQLRRIALARLSLRPSALLLLDEPTAALDAETEALVISRLATLCEGKTAIVLTHRAAPLTLASRVFSLDALPVAGQPGRFASMPPLSGEVAHVRAA